MARSIGADHVYMTKLLDTGAVRPVMDRRFTLREVPEAFRYLQKEHAQGKVVITV